MLSNDLPVLVVVQVLFTAHLAALLLGHAADARGAFCLQRAAERRAACKPGAPTHSRESEPS